MSRRGRKSHEVVADAMRVRRWVLEALTAAQRDPRSRVALSTEAVADIPAAVWQLVLQVDCVALPVLRALPDGEVIDPAIRALISALSLPGLQRCMTAGAQLREIDALCAAHGLSPVVLKGGANIALGRDFDLGDIDIYLPMPEAQRFAELVDQIGYVAGARGTTQNLPKRYAPQRLPLEIHHTLHLFASDPAALSETVPIPGFAALRMLAPANHAWQVLHHSVGAHAHRRGLLRDLLSVGFVADRCSADELEAVRAKARRDRRAHDTLALLDLALAVRRGRIDDVRADDHLDRLRAAHYAFADPRFSRWVKPQAIHVAAVMAIEPLARLPEVPAYLWPGGSRWSRPSHPRVVRAMTFAAEQVARLGHRSWSLAIGVSVAVAVSLTVRRALPSARRSA